MDRVEAERSCGRIPRGGAHGLSPRRESGVASVGGRCEAAGGAVIVALDVVVQGGAAEQKAEEGGGQWEASQAIGGSG